MARRLRISHAPGHRSRAVVLARVQALWRQHPDYTVKQIIAHMGPTLPLGTTRAERLLKDCRACAARRSAIHQKVGWSIDRRTTVRIRIAALWKKHPEFTAHQVIEKLGPGPFMTVKWVQHILKACWRASARHSPKQSRTGRRLYYSWRARPRE
jgi:hypothetical protein